MKTLKNLLQYKRGCANLKKGVAHIAPHKFGESHARGQLALDLHHHAVVVEIARLKKLSLIHI